jgi:hypothetical protein
MVSPANGISTGPLATDRLAGLHLHRLRNHVPRPGRIRASLTVLVRAHELAGRCWRAAWASVSNCAAKGTLGGAGARDATKELNSYGNDPARRPG